MLLCRILLFLSCFSRCCIPFVANSSQHSSSVSFASFVFFPRIFFAFFSSFSLSSSSVWVVFSSVAAVLCYLFYDGNLAFSPEFCDDSSVSRYIVIAQMKPQPTRLVMPLYVVSSQLSISRRPFQLFVESLSCSIPSTTSLCSTRTSPGEGGAPHCSSIRLLSS